MNDVKIVLGLRIKQIRNEIGISQEELANRAGLDRTYITSVEKGRRNISIVNIEKICNALNISIKQFFECEEFNV